MIIESSEQLRVQLEIIASKRKIVSIFLKIHNMDPKLADDDEFFIKAWPEISLKMGNTIL